MKGHIKCSWQVLDYEELTINVEENTSRDQEDTRTHNQNLISRREYLVELT